MRAGATVASEPGVEVVQGVAHGAAQFEIGWADLLKAPDFQGPVGEAAVGGCLAGIEEIHAVILHLWGTTV